MESQEGTLGLWGQQGESTGRRNNTEKAELRQAVTHWEGTAGASHLPRSSPQRKAAWAPGHPDPSPHPAGTYKDRATDC